MKSYLRPICLLALLPIAACISGASSQQGLSGTVTGANGVALVGATVTIVAAGQTATTNSEGVYTFNDPGSRGSSVAITASAPGYARQTRLATVAAGGKMSFALRQADLYAQISLSPSADQNTFTAMQTLQQKANGARWTLSQTASGTKAAMAGMTVGMSFTIPQGAIVTPDGATATGNANLALTYWQPGGSLSDAPGSMNATFNGQVIPLETFGMADIQIEQNGNFLQVANGQRLLATFTLPASLQGYMQSVSPSSPIYPSLWYEDEATGLWTQQGTASQGTMTYDSNTATITARLPHLSGWNVDSMAGPNGCVQGRAVDQDGNAVSNQQFNVWLIGLAEREAQYYPTSSDASGNFCVNISGMEAGTKAGADGLDATAPVFASYGDPQVSSCNPLPITLVSQCNKEPSICVGNGDQNVSLALNNCTLPTATIGICHYCPGTTMTACYYTEADNLDGNATTPIEGGCPNIGTIQLPAATSALAQACQKSPLMLEGAACQTNADCCGFTGALFCGDYLCVPTQTTGSTASGP